MSTVLDAIAAIAVLGIAGAVPTAVFIQDRWIAVPVSVLTGSVIASGAATGFLAIGGTLLAWFIGVGTAVALVSLALGRARKRNVRRTASPEPRAPSPEPGAPSAVFVAAAALLVVAVIAVNLRALATSNAGFDARLIYFIHATWLTDSRSVALEQLRTTGILTHAGYPPLVSAAVALGWQVTGNDGTRLAVIIVALLNACGLFLAAWAVVRLGFVPAPAITGRRIFRKMTSEAEVRGRPRPRLGWLPAVCGVGVAILLVFIATGVNEPFLVNGYADPVWSIAMVGAVVYGFVLPSPDRQLWPAVVLLAVAGEAKIEGTVIAVAVILMLTIRTAIRRLTAREMPRGTRLGACWRTLGAAGAGISGLLLWPIVVRLEHFNSGFAIGGPGSNPGLKRARTVYHFMVPYLGVLLLAGIVALVCGLCLHRARRAMGIGSDGWSWGAVLIGLVVVGGAYVVGPGNVTLWLSTSVHRVIEFPALQGWWIIGTWVVVGVSTTVSLWTPDQRFGSGLGRSAPYDGDRSSGLPPSSEATASRQDIRR